MAEAAAFDEFVMARSRHLLRVAFLLTGDHALAEDLLQTALVKCWSVWRRIEGDPEPYVRRVLANTFNSWWRRRWTGERPTGTLPERAGAAPQAEVDERDRVWRALSRLPRQQRLVLVLRYFEDLSEAEIARTLAISAGSVKTHASKGLAKLRLDPSLRALPLPAGDDAPAGNERLVAVRGRIARRRRLRRTATAVTAACLAVIALIAAYALLPQLRAKTMPEPAFPIQLPAFAQSRSIPVDADYYRLGPSAQHDYAARLDRALVWTPSEKQEALFVTCRQPGPDNVVVMVRVNGREARAGACLGEPFLTGSYWGVLDPVRLGLVAGEPAVVSLELQSDHSLPEGTVAVAIGELITFEEFPLVFPSTPPAPLNRVLQSVDPAKITWIDAGGAHHARLIWRGPLMVRARSQSPGRLTVSVDGVPMTTLDFGTLPWTVVEADGTATPPWEAAPTFTSLQSGRNRLTGGSFDPVPGSLITISVQAERMTGDWFVALYPAGQ
ncbi:SigE family RNA polymerase sigma factor [Catellatospora sp. NPDC049609]|uniref:SigE family RNA polymerase sigma factor n=1 Tax=Catellatospora sp. NPDC049609 TaxID=3155505 RepID=UPI00341ACBEF